MHKNLKYLFIPVFIILLKISLPAAQKKIAIIDFSENKVNSPVTGAVRNMLGISLINKKRYLIL